MKAGRQENTQTGLEVDKTTGRKDSRQEESRCAADFALLNLPKGKSVGRSKPETNSSNEQAH